MGMGKAAADYGSCFFGMLIALFGLAIPVSMVIMGATHLDKCPAERYIPIYLIVSGIFYSLAILIVPVLACEDSITSKGVTASRAILGVSGLLLTAWFIAGNVWIYRLHNKYSPDPAALNYCDNTLYLYAFWVTTTTYILLGILLIGCSALICYFFKNFNNWSTT